MYICECGEEFDNIESVEPTDHVLEKHLDVVESIFEDYIEEADYYVSEESADDLYEEAIATAVEDLMDEIVEK
jgi:hypothetical protein